MNQVSRPDEGIAWQRMATLAGLAHTSDLPLLLWPLLWAAWIAGEGEINPSRLAALLIAALLARSAAWFAYTPTLAALSQIPSERRLFAALSFVGALCFALPLGWPGWLVPLSLALLAGWISLRRRSYLSDPLLAAALTAPALAAWLTQGGSASKAGGLLTLAILLWVVAALMIRPLPAGATLAALTANAAPAVAALLRLSALGALALAGRKAHLGVFFGLGLLAALTLTFYQIWNARRSSPLSSGALEAWWGAAIFCGIAFHFLCACQMTTPV